MTIIGKFYLNENFIELSMADDWNENRWWWDTYESMLMTNMAVMRCK